MEGEVPHCSVVFCVVRGGEVPHWSDVFCVVRGGGDSSLQCCVLR